MFIPSAYRIRALRSSFVPRRRLHNTSTRVALLIVKVNDILDVVENCLELRIVESLQKDSVTGIQSILDRADVVVDHFGAERKLFVEHLGVRKCNLFNVGRDGIPLTKVAFKAVVVNVEIVPLLDPLGDPVDYAKNLADQRILLLRFFYSLKLVEMSVHKAMDFSF